ncbi:putative protein kinase-like domain [Rosellinia necatrix]|uniref:Protein kinase domain-containing protein n=1 Tax=Rosellinia necatrix TaxID=77044 RepID=A0A1W2TK54_ROSNE|nr:putative protein kinase-like domain [Rosellinia necatrix]
MEESNQIAELKERLRDAENRAKEAERGRREEKIRRHEAERRRHEEERRRRKEERRADIAEARLLPTTLDEYIEACHDLVYTNLTIEPDPEKRTTGSIPPPYAKYFPLHLRPWTDFHEKQGEILSNVYLHFSVTRRLFDNRNYLETLGRKARDAPLANEKMLETFLHNCVEDPVRCIIYELSRSRKFQKKFKIGHGIVFENHMKVLSHPSYEVASRQPQQPPPAPPQEPEQAGERPDTPNPATDPPRLNPDQICVYRYEEEGTEKRTAIAVSEYKPPHKLSLPQLRAGLREIDMMEVVTNNKIPQDEEDKFRHHATELVASAVTQAFHYMVKSGLAYGLLTTGEGIVFLKINWDDPHTAYYHLAEPAEEVPAHNDNYRACSAVSQYLGFHLLALNDYSYRGQDVRDWAISGLDTWSTGFRKAASTIPKAQRTPPQNSPAYTPSVYMSVDRTVPRRSQRLMPDGEYDSGPAMRESDEDDSDEEGSRSPNRRDTPSPTERQASRRSARLARRHSGDREGRAADGGGRTRSHGGRGSDRSDYEGKPHQDLAYCTQKCLLGLVKGDALDPDCPNLTLHQHQNNNGSVINFDNRHSIGHDEFLQLLSCQLQCTLDYGITSLDITGARGALFKVTLLEYGYTFISKGTVQAFIPDLEHEARVYERLKDVQGVYVPVFLGAINLRSLNRTYYYDFRVDIVHLCFMSWGGLSLKDGQDLDTNRSTLQHMAIGAMRAIHQQRVVHKDARYENILFNPQTGGVMLIDFERSQLLDMPRPVLATLELNKRRRARKLKGRTKSVGYSGDFSADLAGVEAAF